MTAVFLRPVAPGGWRDLALCANADPELFYPARGESARPARRICAACQVRPHCLQDALDRRELHGIRGGLTERERRALARQPVPARRCPRHGSPLAGGPAVYRCPAGHDIPAGPPRDAA